MRVSWLENVKKFTAPITLTVFLNTPNTTLQLTVSATLAAKQAALFSFVNETGSVFWGGNDPLWDPCPGRWSECLSPRKELAEEACPGLTVDAIILWQCCAMLMIMMVNYYVLISLLSMSERFLSFSVFTWIDGTSVIIVQYWSMYLWIWPILPFQLKAQ